MSGATPTSPGSGEPGRAAPGPSTPGAVPGAARGSPSHQTAAILSIGDELTLGQTLDTNSQWLSARLVEIGVLPVEHATVADDRAAIGAALRRLAAVADVVICTGGLGPTEDDLTREALADVMGNELIRDEAAAAAIVARFKAGARPMPERNLVQALRPRGAACLANPNGTAPGLAGRVGERGVEVFCLPGPPGEMMPMFEAEVRPRLRPGRAIVTRAVQSFGLGESVVAEKLGDLMQRGRNPLVGTTVRGGVVTCRVRFESEPGHPRPGFDAARQGDPVSAVVDQIRERLGEYVFGEGDDTLASALIAMLRKRGLKLATVESCTGGLLGGAITAVAGSSDVYLGGWVTYANKLKVGEIGVPAEIVAPGGPGAVSREAAAAMARGGLERSGADVCISITGVAGPGGGSALKPVGTVWIGLARLGAEGEQRRFLFAGSREAIRLWSVSSALAMARLALVRRSEMQLLRQVE